MIGVQLGWLADALNWLFQKVLNPVFDWLSNLLSTVFSWIFNNILQPVLKFVYETFLAEILHAILYQICLRLLGIFELLLMVVDCITKLFRIFAGLSPVTMTYNADVNGTIQPITVENSLLYCLYKTPFVRGAIIALVSIGFGLCFLFALIAVIRSIFDYDGKEGKSVSHVLRMTAQAFLKLIFAPLFGMFMIVLSGAILTSIDRAFSGSGNEFSITRTIFVITTFDAVKTDTKSTKKSNSKNVTTTGTENLDPNDYNTSTGKLAAFDDPYRKPFYDPGGKLKGADLMYDPFEVDKVFDIVKINYLEGYLLCLAFIIMLIASMLIFLCRIFDVILLLITGPLFVAPMPFDDGEHYEKWQELFIGKLFGGYGMIVAMNTYLIVAAALFNNSFRLVEPGNAFSVLEDALIKLVFMIGGVFAVLNIGPLVTSILSQTAGNAEMQQGAVMSGAMWDAVFTPGKIQQQLRGMAKQKLLGGKVGEKGKVMSKEGQKFAPSQAPRQGRGSMPGLSGAGRAYAMSTMMSTPERTMRKKGEKFSDGTSMDAILGTKGLEIDQRTVSELRQNFVGGTAGKPEDKPAGKPSEQSASQKPGADSVAGGLEGASLIGKDKEKDQASSFTGQSTTQAARGSDLGVPPAPTTTTTRTTTTTTTTAAGGTKTTTTTTQTQTAQPSMEQDLGIAPPPPSADGMDTGLLDSTIPKEGESGDHDGGKF